MDINLNGYLLLRNKEIKTCLFFENTAWYNKDILR